MARHSSSSSSSSSDSSDHHRRGSRSHRSHRSRHSHHGDAKIRSLRVEIQDGHDLASTSILTALKDPHVEVTIGRFHLVSPAATPSSNNRFHFGSVFWLPYSGESRLRLEVKNKRGKEVGFYDFNVAEVVFSAEPFSGRVPLAGTKGKAGELTMQVFPSRERVDPKVSQCLADVKGNVPSTPVSAEKRARSSSRKRHEARSSSESSDGRSRVANTYGRRSLHVTVTKCEGLFNPEIMGKLDPYVQMRLGAAKLSSEPQRNAGSNPKINTTFLFPYNGEKSLCVEIYDEQKMTSDRRVGLNRLDLEKYLPKKGPQELVVPLRSPKKKTPGGVAYIQLEFFDTPEPSLAIRAFAGTKVKEEARTPKAKPDTAMPSVSSTSSSESRLHDMKSKVPNEFHGLMLHVENGRDLYDPERFGKMDPYVCVRVGNSTLKSEICRDVGPNPDFETLFHFPYLNQKYMRIEVFDHEHLKSDRKAGVALVDLEPFLKPGGHKTRIGLRSPKGELKGEVNARFEFTKAVLMPEVSTLPTSHAAPTVGGGARKPGETKSPGALKRADSSDSSRGMTKITTPHQWGTLIVAVERGEEIHDPQRTGKMDPFLKVRLGNQWLKSKVCRDAGKNPNLNALFTFPYFSQRRMRFEVYDRERLIADRICGVGILDLEPMLATPENTVVLPLTVPGKKQEGRLYMTVRFITAVAPEPNVSFIEDLDAKKKMEKERQKLEKERERLSKEREKRIAASERARGRELRRESIDSGDVRTNIPNQFHALKVTVDKVENLPDPEMIGKMDPYVAIRVGKLWLKSETCRNAGSNVAVHTEYFFPYASHRNIRFDAYDNQVVGADRKVGTAAIDVEPFLRPGKYNLQIPLLGGKKLNEEAGVVHATLEFSPNIAEPEVITLPQSAAYKSKKAPKASTSKQADDVSSDGKTRTHVAHACRSLKCVVVDAKDLHDPQKFGKMDPYVKVRLGSAWLKSPVCRDAGPNPNIDTLFSFPYFSERNLRFEVYDRERLASDRLCGRCTVNLEPFLNKPGVHEQRLALRGPKGEKQGELTVRLEMSPQAAKECGVASLATAVKPRQAEESMSDSSSYGKTKTAMTFPYRGVAITVHKGIGLYSAEKIGKIDPYLRVRVGRVQQKSEVMNNAGTDPSFDTTFLFPFKNHKHIKLSVYDRQRITKDRALGSCKFDVEPLLAASKLSSSQKIQLTGPDGSPRGALECGLDFLKEAITAPEMHRKVKGGVEVVHSDSE